VVVETGNVKAVAKVNCMESRENSLGFANSIQRPPFSFSGAIHTMILVVEEASEIYVNRRIVALNFTALNRVVNYPLGVGEQLV